MNVVLVLDSLGHSSQVHWIVHVIVVIWYLQVEFWNDENDGQNFNFQSRYLRTYSEKTHTHILINIYEIPFFLLELLYFLATTEK